MIGRGAGILVSDVCRRVIDFAAALSAGPSAAFAFAAAASSSAAHLAAASSSSRLARSSSSTLLRSSSSSALAVITRCLSSSISRAISSRSSRSAASRASLTSRACRRLRSLVCLTAWRLSSASCGDCLADDDDARSPAALGLSSSSLVASLGLREIIPHEAHIHLFPAGLVRWFAKGASHCPHTFSFLGSAALALPLARASSCSRVRLQYSRQYPNIVMVNMHEERATAETNRYHVVSTPLAA